MVEGFQERAAVAAVADVVARVRSLGAVEHHEVVAAAALAGLGRRGLGLLVPVLAVDHRGEALLGVALDVLPDVQHRAAGRVHQRAAACHERFEQLEGDAERRQDDDVVARDRIDRFARVGQEADALARSWSLTCGLWMISPVRKIRRSGKRDPRLVGVVHRAVHAVAEAELAREVDREPPRRE